MSFVLIGALWGFSPDVARAGGLVSVAEAHWAGSVDRASATLRNPLSQGDVRRPLYLWTRLKGSGEAIAILRAEGKLPLRHSWIASIGGVRLTDPTDEIDLDIGQEQSTVYEALQREVDARGFFDWRTWSGKRHLFPGLWIVTVQYADGSAVMCNGVPCEYTIQVR